MENVNPAPTKTKPGNLRANHAQAIRTALPVPPIAHSMPIVVQPVPMPVVLQHVMHVLPVNTMAKPVKRLNLRAFPHACGTRAHACVHTLFEHSLHTCTCAHHVCTTNISVKDQIDIAQIYVVDDDGTCSTCSCKIIHKFVCVLYNFKYNSLLCWLRLHLAHEQEFNFTMLLLKPVYINCTLYGDNF